MKTTADPQKVMVTGAISFHAALAAIQEFAEKYPIERVSRFQIKAVVEAAATLNKRMNEWEAAQWTPVAKECCCSYHETHVGHASFCPMFEEPNID